MLYEGLSQADEPRVSAVPAGTDSDPRKAFCRNRERRLYHENTLLNL